MNVASEYHSSTHHITSAVKERRMVRLTLMIVTLGVTLFCTSAEEEGLYSDRYDDVDPVEILANRRLRDQYYNCFMGTRAQCKTDDARFFKEIIFDAFLTKCRRCTEKQKQNLDILTEWYVKNEPVKWNAFIVKSLDEARKKNISK